MSKLPDVQNENDVRNIPLSKVGIKEVILPFCFHDFGQSEQTSTGNFLLTVDLAAEKKGVNMSRFMQILTEQNKRTTTLKDIETLLIATNERLGSDASYIEVLFDYFIDKASPKVGITAPMAYQVKLCGTLNQAGFKLEIESEIIASNCCPCSREISQYGAHNQRLKIKTQIELKNSAIENFCLKDFLLDLEQASSCPVYPILKRPDEKYVTETQYENPKFVEDVARDAVQKLRNWKQHFVEKFNLSAEALESIHRHNAWAWHQE